MVGSHTANLSTSLGTDKGTGSTGGSAGGTEAWDGREKTKKGNSPHVLSAQAWATADTEAGLEVRLRMLQYRPTSVTQHRAMGDGNPMPPPRNRSRSQP